MKEKIDNLISSINKVILGNQKQIELAVICLLANGNLLIEDLLVLVNLLYLEP